MQVATAGSVFAEVLVAATAAANVNFCEDGEPLPLPSHREYVGTLLLNNAV